MSNKGTGFGGFLVGLGIGLYLFRYIDFSFDVFSYLLIIMGLGMILNGLLRRVRREHPISGAIGGIVGGLILAIFLTQGFGFILNISDEFRDISPGVYRASETFTLKAPITSEDIQLIVNSVNGAIDIYSWSGETVKFDVEVKAKGNTNSQAEDRLADFLHDLNSEASGTKQEISLNFPIPSSDWSNYAVIINVYVPSRIIANYNLDTTNGEITLTEISGNSLNIETTNGAIILNNVKAQLLQVKTTNGAIRGTINTPESSLTVTNGGIEISLSKISGEHVFSTTNGGIDIKLPADSETGYMINLDTSIGSVDASLPNVNYSVDRTRTKIGETRDYSSKQVQIEITADTTIGAINLH
jgi:hypothetical protein